MVGGIYSDQKCFICDGTLKDDGKKGLACVKHPKCHATTFKVIFKGITKRFRDYEKAQRFLTGLRFKTDEETYDERDYRKNKPLGFANLTEKFLEAKRRDVKPKSYNNLANYMDRATQHFKNDNIKEIGYPELEDFLLSQKLANSGEPVSHKTRANIKSALHDFWDWLRKRRILTLAQMPEFPETRFELGWRKIITKTTQNEVLEEVYRLTHHINPKIYLGIKWLSTYIKIRPGELLQAREQDFDLELGCLLIPHPKEKEGKIVPLLPEDVEIMQAMPKAIDPALPFFRHEQGISSVKPGQPFGEKYFYKWWKRACANLGIEGVDLYGGTRHSTARALRKHRTPEEIKRATGHSTNKAFERYFQFELEDVRAIYADAQPDKADKELTKDFGGSEKAKLLKFKG